MPAVLVLDDRPMNTLPTDDQDVAAIHRARRLDESKRAMARQFVGDRRRLVTPRHRPRPGDDRHLVEHDGRVLDEDAIRHLGTAPQANDVIAGIGDRHFVCGVLPPRPIDVDRDSCDVRQLARRERGADFSRQRNGPRHGAHDSGPLVMVVGYWLLVVGYWGWLLVSRGWLVGVGYWGWLLGLVIGYGFGYWC